MFETHVGPVSDSASVAYLRPETAQGIFINFKNVLQFARKKPPFGIAQIGKSFRNEITTGNFIFRTREFEQMEMEFFCPARRGRALARALAGRADALVHRARDPARQPDPARPRRRRALALLVSATSDIEYRFPMGFSELEGIANRGDFDLTQHAEHSGEKLEYFDQQTKERYVPHVIEPAAGVDRAMLAFMVDAYDTEEVEGRAAHRAAPAPEARAGQGRGAAAGLDATGCPSAPARSSTRSATGSRPSTTRAARSASATAARTRSAPRGG